MNIEHIAIWTHQLEVLKQFYIDYFDAIPGEKYHNPRTGFQSYFLSFERGARLELMQQADIPASRNDPERQATGLIHLAFSTGSRQEVDTLTKRLRELGYKVVSEPRTTGDGYYESVILDPDGNRIEITE